MSEVRVLERQGDVSVVRDGHVLIITLNRPERLNALTLEMRTTLQDVITSAANDPSVRAIVFTGEGRAFCSGADAESLESSTGDDMETRYAGRRYFTPRQCQIYKPTICAVNGICAGAGLHFVSDCDIVIASSKAQFVDPHVNVGQVTAAEPIGLARRMPVGPVLRMVILGKAERLSADQALAVHLVSEVIEPERLMERALNLAHTAAMASPAALQASLKAFWTSYDLAGLTASHEAAYEAVMLHRDHPDAREGPAAFLAKRPPVWRDQ